MKKEFIAPSSIEKLNIKSFLESCCGVSSRKAKQLIKAKQVQINNRTAYNDNHVKIGDKVVVDFSEVSTRLAKPQAIPIEIVYEDDYFIAVNKPAGMLVHPTENYPDNTLANGVSFYFSSIGLAAPVRFANRIDRDTSGLVIIAKSGEAHAALAKQFESDSCEKYYLAIAEGCFADIEGSIDKPIGIDDEKPIRRKVREDGQRCITEYKVLKQYQNAALLRLKLITGRTHQIRVHLSSLGHPLLGDELYDGSLLHIHRQALHSSEMIFRHPYANNEIKLQAKLPEDLQQLIELLNNKDNNTEQEQDI